MLCIAGNKCDMEKQRQVPDEEAELYAESVGAFHQKVSAKSGRGVEEVFLTLSKTMLENSTASSAANSKNSKPQNRQKNGGVTVIDEPTSPPTSGGCCSSS